MPRFSNASSLTPWSAPEGGGRIGFLEPDRFCREERKRGSLGGSIDVCLSPSSLVRWAGAGTRDPLLDRIVIGLPDRLPKQGWAELDAALRDIGPSRLPVYVDARRCDIERANALTGAGAYLLCGDVNGAHPLALGQIWLGSPASLPVPHLKTLGASELATHHGLRPREYRVVRTLMDVDRKALPQTLGIAPKTAEAHVGAIRLATGMTTTAVVRKAFEWALVATRSLVAHPFADTGEASGVYLAASRVKLASGD